MELKVQRCSALSIRLDGTQNGGPRMPAASLWLSRTGLSNSEGMILAVWGLNQVVVGSFESLKIIRSWTSQIVEQFRMLQTTNAWFLHDLILVPKSLGHWSLLHPKNDHLHWTLTPRLFSLSRSTRASQLNTKLVASDSFIRQSTSSESSYHPAHECECPNRSSPTPSQYAPTNVRYYNHELPLPSWDESSPGRILPLSFLCRV